MRRWLLILMVTLLPIRGWVGDAMAMEMAASAAAHANSSQHTATLFIAINVDRARIKPLIDINLASEGDADCPGHAEALPTGPDASPATEAGHDACNACTSCQVCHTVALAAAVNVSASNVQHFVTPPTLTSPFVSAPPARGFKPPIS
jgi:hypothetical protein